MMDSTATTPSVLSSSTASTANNHIPFGCRQFTDEERSHISQNLRKMLAPELLANRAGPAGTRLTYVEGYKVIVIANEIFGFNGWSHSVLDTTIDFLESNRDNTAFCVGVSCLVRVILKDGTFHEDIGYGSVDNAKSKGAALDKCRKEAVTDAIKRALKAFGNALGLSLYDKDALRKLSSIPSRKSLPLTENEVFRLQSTVSPNMPSSSMSSPSMHTPSNPVAGISRPPTNPIKPPVLVKSEDFTDASFCDDSELLVAGDLENIPPRFLQNGTPVSKPSSMNQNQPTNSTGPSSTAASRSAPLNNNSSTMGVSIGRPRVRPSTDSPIQTPLPSFQSTPVQQPRITPPAVPASASSGNALPNNGGPSNIVTIAKSSTAANMQNMQQQQQQRQQQNHNRFQQYNYNPTANNQRPQQFPPPMQGQHPIPQPGKVPQQMTPNTTNPQNTNQWRPASGHQQGNQMHPRPISNDVSNVHANSAPLGSNNNNINKDRSATPSATVNPSNSSEPQKTMLHLIQDSPPDTLRHNPAQVGPVHPVPLPLPLTNAASTTQKRPYSSHSNANEGQPPYGGPPHFGSGGPPLVRLGGPSNNNTNGNIKNINQPPNNPMASNADMNINKKPRIEGVN